MKNSYKLRTRYGISWLLFGLVRVFDVVKPEGVRVLPATINISGGARGINGFATLRNFINVQFVAEERAEVVRDISRSARVV